VLHHCGEDRSAHLIRHRQLAIQYRDLGIHLSNKSSGQFQKPMKLMFLPGHEPAVPSIDQRQGSEAVVLDLEHPVWIVKWLRLLA
jgi:hypothetical protein